MLYALWGIWYGWQSISSVVNIGLLCRGRGRKSEKNIWKQEKSYLRGYEGHFLCTDSMSTFFLLLLFCCFSSSSLFCFSLLGIRFFISLLRITRSMKQSAVLTDTLSQAYIHVFWGYFGLLRAYCHCSTRLKSRMNSN